MAGKYKKCPRCELNYILVEEELCQVCKTELKLAPSEEEDDLELCTLCGKNLITVDQVMCDDCARKRNIDDVVDELSDDEEGAGKDSVSEWDQQKEDDLGGIVDADDDVEVVSFSDLEDEEDDYDDEEEEVDHFEEEDDFDLDNLDDYDEDDDDDDYDDEDDDDDDFLQKKKK